MSRLLITLAAVLGVIASCGKLPGKYLEKSVALKICGIAPNETLAAVDSIALFSFARDGVSFSGRNGIFRFRARTSEISGSDRSEVLGKPVIAKLSDGMMIYSYSFSGKSRRTAEAALIRVEETLSNGMTDLMPRILRKAADNSGGGKKNFDGMAWLNGLEWESHSNYTVFHAEIEIGEGVPDVR